MLLQPPFFGKLEPRPMMVPSMEIQKDPPQSGRLGSTEEQVRELVTRELIEIHRVALGFDIGRYEEVEASQVNGELLPETLSQLERGLVAFGKLADAAASLPREAVDGPKIDLLEDLSHVARFELVEERSRVERLAEAGEHSEVVSSCANLLLKLGKAATAVENSWCQLLGLASKLCPLSGLEQSLKTRRAYAKFRLAVTWSEAFQSTHELRQHLKKVATAIACLGGRDAYWNFRFSDRLQLRALQRRLLDWIADPEAPADDGFHLWQDLESFVHLLDLINSRSELNEHDYHLVYEADTVLFSDDDKDRDGEEIPQEWVTRLEALLGRDLEADRLLFSLGPQTLGQWRGPIERLLNRLAPVEARQTQEWRRGDTAEVYPSQFVPGDLGSDGLGRSEITDLEPKDDNVRTSSRFAVESIDRNLGRRGVA